MAAHLEPEILLVDEVLSVGDAEFQRRSLGRMEEFSRSGRTVVFVSHQMPSVARLCDRAILLDGGQVVRDGQSDEVVAQYLQSVTGTPSRRVWPDLESAPGGKYAGCARFASSTRTAKCSRASTSAARWASR